jgi:hypothetical protein
MGILYVIITSFCTAGLTSLIFSHFIKCSDNKYCIYVRSFLIVFLGVLFGSIVLMLV